MIVQGQRLDLFKNEVFAVSKAVSKLGEFDLRHGDVSIKYKVPTTNKNISIFGYLSNLNNYNNNAFKRFSGELREDESVVSSGFFQVLKINPRESIEVRFYGGNSEWFDQINDRDINGTYPNTVSGGKSYDLGFLNHKFLASTIVDSWDNDDEYFYFPVDNGENRSKTDNVFELTDFQLGIFQHSIVKAIFDSIGVKTKGTLFNDPLYYNTLINQPTDNSKIALNNNTKRFTSTTQVLSPENDPYTPLVFNLNDQDEQWSGTVFTAAFDAVTTLFSFDLTTNLDATYFDDNAELSIQTKVNGVVVDTSSISVDEKIDETLNFQYSFEFTDTGGDEPALSFGDTVEFLFVGNYSYPGGSIQINVLNNSSIQYQLEGVTTPFRSTDAIPQINQANFIKDVMFRHGVISQFDSKTRTLTLDKLQDVQNNKINAVNYSNKIDLSKPPSYDFTKVLSGFNKVSKIIYTQDDNDLDMEFFRAVNKSNVGDAVINIDNDNLTGEGVVYESKFSGTIQIKTFSNNFYVPSIEFMKSDGETFEAQDMKPRIFVKAGNIPVSDFSKTYSNISFNGTQSSVGYAYFAKEKFSTGLDSNTDTLSFDNINESTINYIGTTLLEKNYRLYIDLLNSPIHLSINLNLKPLDMQKVDFMKPVWLDFSLDSGYYYINNINQYKGDGSTTKVELVKI